MKVANHQTAYPIAVAETASGPMAMDTYMRISFCLKKSP